VTAFVFERTRSWARGSKTVHGWRERRYRVFLEQCQIRPEDRIVDVGAGLGLALECFNGTNPITAVDLVPQENEWMARPNVQVVQGDGTQLEFGDDEFDAAFSSSVIEHVPRHLQAAFAAEVRRVARRYYVQTPNRWFLIEPHYQLPLFHFLPKRIQRALNRRFTLGWQQKGEWEEINLLSAREMRRLFPDATIHRERVFGLTKSLMAIR
jgi:2-polyprenyl-3-methyl-5-hydroxy-6-metoxy-1,4-benzoquinol methylase